MPTIAPRVTLLIVIVLLALPQPARSAPNTTPVQVIVPSPQYSPLLNKREFGLVDLLITDIGFPALDAASKDAAKMTIKLSPEYTRIYQDKWRCSDVVVQPSILGGGRRGIGQDVQRGELLPAVHPIQLGSECVAHMKIPANTKVNFFIDFSNAGGWIQSVEGGHGTADSVTDKIGPDHIVHKHIAGVKYEDLTVNPGQTTTVNVIVRSYVPTRMPL